MTEPASARPPLDSDRLRHALRRSVPGAEVEVLGTAPSTNALLADRARAGEPEWRVLVTEHQTAGRGRLDRVWETPPRAALTFSVLLRPHVAPARWPWLPLLTGLAVVRGLDGSGVEAGLKWPNDVLAGDAKLAGILVERVEGPAGAAAVVGVGLNVSTTPEELPVPTATSLVGAGAGQVDRTELLGALLGSLRREYDAWQAGGQGPDAALREDYVRRCVTLGRRVRVELPAGGSTVGEAVDVDAGGRLLVRTGSGVTAVGAGDVVHVRPAD